MTEQEWRQQFEKEGYRHLQYVEYPPFTELYLHTHLTLTTQIILEGELLVFEGEKNQHFKTGDRFEVPKNTEHYARAGSAHLKMLLGFKP